jgi:hypothetical protein
MIIIPCEFKECKFWQEIDFVTNFTRLERLKMCLYCVHFLKMDLLEMQKEK